MRLTLEIVEITRATLSAEKPLFMRISGTDCHPHGEQNDQGEYISWGIEQSKVLVVEALKRGVALVDVSAGGNDTNQVFKVAPGYQVGHRLLEVRSRCSYLSCSRFRQVPLAEAIRSALPPGSETLVST